MKVLFCVGEGMGNVIQTLPVAEALASNGISFDVLNLSNCSNQIVSYIFGAYTNVIRTFIPEEYTHRLELPTTAGNLQYSERFSIKEIVNPSLFYLYRLGVNEVDTYLQMVSTLIGGVSNKYYDVCLPTIKQEDVFDVVIHNGCSLVNPTQWERKKYQEMCKLTESLVKKGLTVVTIGAPQEYECSKTVNKTGLDIERSAALIKESTLFISNDTGTYHLCAALKSKGFCIFTATSVSKNWNSKFHKTIKVFETGLDCQPCQYKKEWNNCTMYACRHLSHNEILKEIENERIF